MGMRPVLYIIVPCYNDAEVIPLSTKLYLDKMAEMEQKELISADSRIMLVNDGSPDNTWEVIQQLSEKYERVFGISLSRNRGHQNAVIAGLTEAMDRCDITITIDDDGQDDVNAMEDMVRAYHEGCEIVYGVRKNRNVDKPMKRYTAQSFYKFMRAMGVESVYNHADYRLVSNRVLKEFQNFKEVNLYLRGMFPLVGFKSTCVYYERKERMAGKSNYSIGKLIGLAVEGITSLSIRPLHIITVMGGVVSFLSFIAIIWSIATYLMGDSNAAGWASTICIICFLGGIQLISIGILGEYIGKVYLEVKARPRFIISERTEDEVNQ